MTTTGWHYSFEMPEVSQRGGIKGVQGTMVGQDLDTEEKARAELVERWGKAAEKARLRRCGDGT